MGRDLSHADLQELLGAFALDAVDPDERDAVERHLRECPRCRAEVAEHREVAGFLGNTGLRAPDQLWDRISGALDAAPPEAGLGQLLSISPAARRRRRLGLVGGAVAAAVAAASIAVLGVQLERVRDRVDRTEAAMAGEGVLQAAVAAESEPGARRVELVASDGEPGARAVLLPDGRGYLVPLRLDRLPAGRTYQLWGIVDGEPVSAGVLGAAPRVTAFTLASPRVGTLALSEEDAPGAVQPSSAPVLAGTVPA